MKVIHLSDTHLVGGDRMLYGGNPRKRLAQAVDSIQSEHGDAACVVITGDLTHWGEAAAYDSLAKELARLSMPVHLLLGNHDDPAAFARAFPAVEISPEGFVQFAQQTPQGWFLGLDTHHPDLPEGRYCAARRAWLTEQLQRTEGAVYLFMHHPPLPVGMDGLDRSKLQEAEALAAVLAPHQDRIRHLFFGHLHRAVCGQWRGISFSGMRGLNHQMALDLAGQAQGVAADLAAPAYGVVLIDDQSLCVHLHEYAAAYASPHFDLRPPEGTDEDAHALIMRHAGWGPVGPL